MTRVIAAVASAAGYVPHQSCYFFATAGALLLQQHHGLAAVALAGAAAYCLVGPGDGTLCYGRPVPDALMPNDRQYHCWIECEGHALDLLAPLFPDIMDELRAPGRVLREDFCRPLQQAQRSLAGLVHPGDFYLAPDFGLTHRMLESLDTPSTAAFLEDCLRWYRPASAVPEHLFSQQFDLARDAGRARLPQL